MRCPKCQYLSFDAGDRCRNCGYEFSLASDPAQPDDLTLRSEPDALGPLADLPLGADPREPLTDPGSSRPSGRRLRGGLPLFSGDADAVPLRPPPAPRTPLSVRRPTPEVPRVRQAPVRRREEEPRLDLETATDRPAGAATGLRPADRETDSRAGAGVPVDLVSDPAGIPQRALAGTIDVTILGLIDAAVLYFTLRLCGLEVYELSKLPVGPLAAFLLLLNGGYFVAFTAAGGQTLGKMAARIRVIGSRDARMLPRTAIVRTAAYVISLLPLGLGFLAALTDPDRRALHDRLAATRVVKVS